MQTWAEMYYQEKLFSKPSILQHLLIYCSLIHLSKTKPTTLRFIVHAMRIKSE